MHTKLTAEALLEAFNAGEARWGVDEGLRRRIGDGGRGSPAVLVTLGAGKAGSWGLSPAEAVTLAGDLTLAAGDAVVTHAELGRFVGALAVVACRMLVAEVNASRADAILEVLVDGEVVARADAFADNLDLTQAEGQGPRYGVTRSTADWPEATRGVIAWFGCPGCAKGWADRHGHGVLDLVEGRRMTESDFAGARDHDARPH